MREKSSAARDELEVGQSSRFASCDLHNTHACSCELISRDGFFALTLEDAWSWYNGDIGFYDASLRDATARSSNGANLIAQPWRLVVSAETPWYFDRIRSDSFVEKETREKKITVLSRFIPGCGSGYAGINRVIGIVALVSELHNSFDLCSPSEILTRDRLSPSLDSPLDRVS